MKVDASNFLMVNGTQMPKILELILVSLKKTHGILQCRLIVGLKKARIKGDIID